jgi:hypothetical protein
MNADAMTTYTLHVPLDTGVMPDAECAGAIACDAMRMTGSEGGTMGAGMEFTYRLGVCSAEESLAGGVRILDELADVIPLARGRRRCEHGSWIFSIDMIPGFSEEACRRYTRAYGDEGYAGSCQVFDYLGGHASLRITEKSFHLLHARLLVLEREIGTDMTFDEHDSRPHMRFTAGSGK